MRGVNKVILIGNVGNDPEVRQVGSTQLANLSLATSESWKDKQTGERREKTEWHRLKVWGRLAEIAGQYVRKGSKLYIEGKLETSTYEKNGEKRYSTEVIVSNLQMLDSPSGGGQREGRGWDDPPRSQRPPAQRQPEPAMPDDDDIPF